MSHADPQPQLILLGGSNGAGKTTSAKVLLPRLLKVAQFVNADEIARGLSPYAPESAALEAGKLLLKRIRTLADRRESFALESTLAGVGHARFCQKLKRQGYRITLIYVWLDDPGIAIHRVEERVRKGGHDIPPDEVRRRYDRSLINFVDRYRPLADEWVVIDNSYDLPTTIARKTHPSEREVILEPDRYRDFEQALEQARQRAS